MENNLTYTRNGDYLIPDLSLSEQPEKSLGKYGRMRKAYATILANEDRSKELRQIRPSVREYLKQEPKQATTKAPAHKKQEPER